MRELSVDFDDPEHGWIKISVGDDVHTVAVEVDSKSHSFHELTTALIGLIDGRGELTVTWLEEPVVTEWRFTRRQDEVVFELRRSPSMQPALRFAGSYQEVCLPFWRALRSLKGRFTKPELEERMQDEFPFLELERLTVKIQAMESGPSRWPRPGS